ncbi:MAG: hypothetical protein ACLGI9_20685 [Thermoanaerobaculia bacterium]
MNKRLLLPMTVLLVSALPAGAGVSLDRTSPSIGGCGFPVNPARIFSLVPPGGGCDVGGAGPKAEVLQGALGLVANDNVDGLSANTLTSEALTYYLVLSADRASVGQAGTPLRGEAVNNQAASDLWRTNLTGGSPAAAMAGGGCVPFVVPTPPHSLHRNQTAFNMIQTAPPGAAAGGALDNIDAVEMDVLDTDGNGIHDVDVYFSLDPASPNLLFSGAEIYFAPAGAPFGPFSLPAQIGLQAGDDIDSLVIWDRGVLGVADAGVDFVLFSLAPGSPTLALFGLSPAMIFVSHFSGNFCPFVGPGQLGLVMADNVDGLDVMP